MGPQLSKGSATFGLLLAVAIVMLCVALTGCTTMPAAITDPQAVFCENNDPRRPSQATVDAMSRAELDALNLHNRTGVEWCGWQF